MRKTIADSFVRLKDELGLSKTQKSRLIPMQQSELNLMRKEMKNNVVWTSKYNIFTFLPVNLFLQCSKAANIYFMFITVL